MQMFSSPAHMGGQRWALPYRQLLSAKQRLSFLVGGQKSGETEKNIGHMNFPSSKSIRLPDTALPRTSYSLQIYIR